MTDALGSLKNKTGVLGVAIFFFFVQSVTSQAGVVVFDFDQTSVTVVDESSVYVFPNKVFETNFGSLEAGAFVSIDEIYKGFQVHNSQQNVVKTSRTTASLEMSGPAPVTKINYGGAIYYKKNHYYFYGASEEEVVSGGMRHLTPGNIKFTWIVPQDEEEKNVNAEDEGRYFTDRGNGIFSIKGEVLPSGTMGIKAIGIGNKVYYLKGDAQNITDSKLLYEARINQNEILWVANN